MGRPIRIERILNYISQQHVGLHYRRFYCGRDGEHPLNDPATIDALKNLIRIPAISTRKIYGASMNNFEGNFDGIGIEFNIVDDTIMVVAAFKRWTIWKN
ncbi:MAG: hypothetical protein R2794_09700 [Chitinophagales bacterium]